MAKSKLLSALADATNDDLIELDREIEAAERELAETVATMRGRIDSLRAARQLVDLKLNGKKPRAAPVRRAATPAAQPTRSGGAVENSSNREDSDPASLASQIFDLIKREGSLPPNVLASMLSRSIQGINMAITKSGWFTRGADGEIRIATT